MYTQSAVGRPERSAGPNERAGFIEPPEIGPPTRMSTETVAPTAIAAASPIARVSVATAITTNIRIAVSTISQAKARAAEPVGKFPPT